MLDCQILEINFACVHECSENRGICETSMCSINFDKICCLLIQKLAMIFLCYYDLTYY